jgi:hypothetical protein
MERLPDGSQDSEHKLFARIYPALCAGVPDKQVYYKPSIKQENNRQEETNKKAAFF